MNLKRVLESHYAYNVSELPIINLTSLISIYFSKIHRFCSNELGFGQQMGLNQRNSTNIFVQVMSTFRRRTQPTDTIKRTSFARFRMSYLFRLYSFCQGGRRLVRCFGLIRKEGDSEFPNRMILFTRCECWSPTVRQHFQFTRNVAQRGQRMRGM
jgi:hypothetical protein